MMMMMIITLIIIIIKKYNNNNNNNDKADRVTFPLLCLKLLINFHLVNKYQTEHCTELLIQEKYALFNYKC